MFQTAGSHTYLLSFSNQNQQFYFFIVTLEEIGILGLYLNVEYSYTFTGYSGFLLDSLIFGPCTDLKQKSNWNPEKHFMS